MNEIMTGSAAQDRGNPIWNFFRSVKLTLVLLIILAVTSIIGTLVPQKEGAMELAQRISPGLGSLLNALQIFDMYHSFWFRLLIGALALNLIVCSIDRLPAFLKRLRALPKPDRSRPFEDIAPHRSFSVKGGMTEIVDGVLETLKKRYGNIQTKETDKGHFFYGGKGRYTLFGFYLVHLSVLLILIGGIVGSFFGFEA
ncbi:MAG: cytochrome c biogenesis protein ResB, partial [Proteobacteria bacterium]|nr:cytochrome c biogenesis protein ResB [Pseudomonadota bacterium]